MSNFTDPIKAGFGQFLAGFHTGLMADTKAMREFAARDFSECAAWAPGRMVDAVEEMLAAWRKNDTSQAQQPKTRLPVMLVAMSKDFVPAPPEFGRSGAEPTEVMIPGDPKNRVFRMQTVGADIRVQIAMVAPEETTSRSLAMQFHAYAQQPSQRRFAAVYKLVGLDEKWPVVFEIPDILAPSMATEQKNLTILVADLQMRATVPMLHAPKPTEANDGQGAGDNQTDPFGADYDPSGYLTVIEADGVMYPPRIASDTPAIGTWHVEVEP